MEDIFAADAELVVELVATAAEEEGEISELVTVVSAFVTTVPDGSATTVEVVGVTVASPLAFDVTCYDMMVQ